MKGSMLFDTLNVLFLYLMLSLISLTILSLQFPNEKKQEIPFLVDVDYSVQGIGTDLNILFKIKNKNNRTLVLSSNISYNKSELKLQNDSKNIIIIDPYKQINLTYHFILLKKGYFSNNGNHIGSINFLFVDKLTNKSISQKIVYRWKEID